VIRGDHKFPNVDGGSQAVRGLEAPCDVLANDRSADASVSCWVRLCSNGPENEVAHFGWITATPRAVFRREERRYIRDVW
jgi:CelD/BcsL family acetyltransferase involved in cellulose biosynthesis